MTQLSTSILRLGPAPFGILSQLKTIFASATLVLVGLGPESSQVLAQEIPADFPSWAYVMNVGAPRPKVPDDGTLFKVPDSPVGFTRDQTRNRFAPPDWHSADHPAMPAVVANGRKPAVWACAFCHRPNGVGGPENARIAGLPAEYIIQQLRDMASGMRSTAMPGRLPHVLKQPIVKDLTLEEMVDAANYFSQLKAVTNVVVKESSTAPKVDNLGMFYAASEDGSQETLGARIVEVPQDLLRFEVLRDDRVQFTAYVPPGSISKGSALTHASAGNPSLACTTCHGADLRGLGPIPSIAGRSPSYIVRQLWDLKVGARDGAGAQPMKPVVASLSGQDMLAISAYLATLKP
jgi:cytochrome c553